MNLTYPLIVVAIGVAFAAQPAINGAAARALASPLAATAISVAITLLATLAILIAFRSTPQPSAVIELPWWVALGGLIGVLVVAGGAWVAPITGVAVFFVCLVAGQLIGAVALDHFGAFGAQVREVSIVKAIGVLMTLAGAAIVSFAP